VVWIVCTVNFALSREGRSKDANPSLDIVVRVTNDLEMFGFLTLPTLSVIDSNGGMDKNIIYAILHESIYCQG
jgi:hypothetical protein